MDAHFLQAQGDAERGRPAAPWTSRAHKHAILQSFAPQVNVCRDLCDPCAIISHVWSPFHGCGASLQSMALGADFMNAKHHMHTKRCFGIPGFIQKLWIGLFGMLPHFCNCTCDTPACQGRVPCTQNIVHTPPEMFDPFSLPQCRRLPRLEDPHAFRT